MALDITNSMPRFSERDLLMWYHWGLGVGHFHVHQPVSSSVRMSEGEGDQDFCLAECEIGDIWRLNENNVNEQTQNGNSDIYDSDNLELGSEDRDNEGWESEDESDDHDEGVCGSDNVEKEDFTGM
jgi:hypothetical protein